MRQTIHPTGQELKRIFSDHYFFRIPGYQRPYSWPRDHTTTLLDDLLEALFPEGVDVHDNVPYFLGSMVLIKDSNFTDADVVDGQQRLTTLTILPATLRDLSGPKEAEALPKYIGELGDKFSGTEDRFRIQPRPRDRLFFRDQVQQPNAVTLYHPDETQLADSQANIRANTTYPQAGAAERRLPPAGPFCHVPASALLFGGGIGLRQGLGLPHLLGDERSRHGSLAHRHPQGRHHRGPAQGPGEALHRAVGRAKEGPGAGPLRRSVRAYTHAPPQGQGALGADAGDPRLAAFPGLAAAVHRAHPGGHGVRLPERQERRLRPAPAHRGGQQPTDPPQPAGQPRLAAPGHKLLRPLREPSPDPAAVPGGPGAPRLPPVSAPDGGQRAHRPLYPGAQRHRPRGRPVPRGLPPAAELPGEGTGPEDPAPPRVHRGPDPASDPASAGGSVERRDRPPLLRDRLRGARAAPAPGPDSEWPQRFPDPAQRDQLGQLLGLVRMLRTKNPDAQNWDFQRKKAESLGRNGETPLALTEQVLKSRQWTPEEVERRQPRLVSTLANAWRLH